MNTSFRLASGCLAALLCAASPALQAQPSAAPAAARPAAVAQATAATPAARPSAVAQVNGQAVPVEAFELLMQEQLRSGAQDSPALREAVRRELVVQTLLAELAQQSRLQDNPAVALRLAAARRGVLAQAWQQQWVDANPPSDAELAAEYAALKERTGSKEYQIRQVVVRDETAAKLVIEQLKSGKSLSDMAREYSIEPLGKDDGGLLPWLTPASMVEPLAQWVVRAKVGQRAPEPLRTPGGFHIVELVAERPFSLPALENIRPQLLQAVAQRKLTAAIQEQIGKAKVELR